MLPIYTFIAAPFLIISLACAVASKFKLAYKFGFVWMAIFGIIIIPLYFLIIANLTWGYYTAFFDYLTVGFVFYALVCASNVLLYKYRDEIPLKQKKKEKGVVSSEVSTYCQYCGAEIKEGQNTCPNCDSMLT